MRLQLIFAFILIVLVAVSSVAIIALQGAVTEVRAFMFRGGMARASEIASLLEEYYQEHGSFVGAEDLLNMSMSDRTPGMGMGRGPGGPGMMAGRQMGQRLRLADAQGRILLDTATDRPTGVLSLEQLELAIPLRSGSKTVGYLLPESAMTFTLNDERLLAARLTRAALIAGLIAGGLAMALALFLTYRLMRPVHALTYAARRLAEGDLTYRVVIKGSDELAQLSRTFNQMADALQAAQESRKAMTADIAHELRTPLAVQLANLEALQDGIYPLTRENLQPILENNRLLSRLVEDLRILAMADAGQLKLEPAQVNLTELVQRVTEAFYPQAAAQGIQINLDIKKEPPPIWADPGRVEQILTNLLSNALRFTPPGGNITLSLSQALKNVILSVHDSGPGIPPESLPYIFERFYRADRSRSRQEGGSGLGLAIARQLAELHGGRLTASNHPQGGAVFTLTLPIENTRPT